MSHGSTLCTIGCTFIDRFRGYRRCLEILGKLFEHEIWPINQKDDFLLYILISIWPRIPTSTTYSITISHPPLTLSTTKKTSKARDTSTLYLRNDQGSIRSHDLLP